MDNVCVDTGFFLALYDKGDKWHTQAESYFKDYFSIGKNKMIVPWPILYEAVSTKMVRDPRKINSLNRDWKILKKEKRLICLNDLPYRDKALNECFGETKRNRHYWALSLVDRIIINMLSDTELIIDIFITGDSRGGFQDVCKRFRRTIVNLKWPSYQR